MLESRHYIGIHVSMAILSSGRRNGSFFIFLLCIIYFLVFICVIFNEDISNFHSIVLKKFIINPIKLWLCLGKEIKTAVLRNWIMNLVSFSSILNQLFNLDWVSIGIFITVNVMLRLLRVKFYKFDNRSAICGRTTKLILLMVNSILWIDRMAALVWHFLSYQKCN